MKKDGAVARKHKLFVDNYFLCNFNATEAYMRTYKPKNRDIARTNSSELLAKPDVADEINARLRNVHMGADEAVKLLTDQARGDIADLMDISTMGFNLDLKQAQENGKTKLIKKVRQKTVTINGKEEDQEIITLEVELYDAQAALEKILRLHGKFKEQVEHSGTVKLIIERSDDAPKSK